MQKYNTGLKIRKEVVSKNLSKCWIEKSSIVVFVFFCLPNKCRLHESRHLMIFNYLLSFSREGNGNPLRYSYLENPMDRVHGVAQSRTRLKRLSMHECTGEGSGNSLQYSCLENSRDRGAWWAAVCGVAQSQTRLKRLSSSSSCSRKVHGT